MQNTPGHRAEGAAIVLGGTGASYKNSNYGATAEALPAIDYAAMIVASRHQLSPPVARCVAALAALGGAA